MADSATVSLIATWSVPLKEARSIAAALQMLVGSTRTQPGCEGCQVTTELGDVAVIHYLERWKTEADLQRQVRSVRFSSLAELLERATDTPVVRFVLGRETRGLDYADEVRRQRS